MKLNLEIRILNARIQYNHQYQHSSVEHFFSILMITRMHMSRIQKHETEADQVKNNCHVVIVRKCFMLNSHAKNAGTHIILICAIAVVNDCPILSTLTHWGWVTHICIGSYNGMSSGRCQVITWTNAGILLTELLGINFSEISIGIHTFLFRKMYLKMSSAKWCPFLIGLNVFTRVTNG